MRRDMDLLRLLLLKLEVASEKAAPILCYRPGELSIDGYTDDQVRYHYALAVDAGLVDQGGKGPINGLQFRRLTWAGHDFVDAVRDNEIWAKTQQGASAAGGFGLELLKDLAKGFIKKKIVEHTGIEI
ncbi:DUF2513 domain-containing protein [Pseudomonas fulva]|uniref:DUF2513 domain-containing protein n=1 Tax=unclassified Pseudomonas TaxID=196821 RepID=UPI000C8815E4|nr:MULTISPECIES: DUF2513 domain-containing protein [unclassified Pseudomonas]PNA93624.1 hypothetical protein C1X74_20930 [Pseudomonas sp. GW460-5]PNB56176.1 hypothetical protein C1X73_20140 [Pseudomonas sp. FW305-130]